MEGLGKREPRCTGCGREIHQTAAGRDRIAHRNADEDGGQLHDALAVVIEDHHHDQCDEGNRPVQGCAVIRTGTAAGHVVHGGGIQRKSDGEYHGSCDQRREEALNLLDKKSHNHSHDTADNLSPENGSHTAGAGNGLHGGHIGKADAHDHRQTTADMKSVLFAQSVNLQQGGQRRHHQRGLDHQHLIRIRQARCIGHDDGRGHTAHNHGHNVLECHGKHFADPRRAFHFEERALQFRFRFCIHTHDATS